MTSFHAHYRNPGQVWRTALFGLLAGALVALALAALPPSAASAASFQVNATGDTVDADPGNGTCADAGGQCSLRAAIMEANATSGADTITVAASINGSAITLTLAGTGENAGATGDLDVLESVTITGNGPTNTIIQAGTSTAAGIDRVLEINPNGNSQANVTLSALTIRYGNSNDGLGGGISFWGCSTYGTGCNGSNQGTLTLNNVHLKNNREQNVAFSSGGGGLLVEDGHVVIQDSVISGNEATIGVGGGIAVVGNHSSLSISNTTVSGNQALAAAGGGIYFHRDSATTSTFTVTGSTISGNTAYGRGGGLYVELRSNTDLSIQDTTISGNTSTPGASTSAGGGGLWASGATGLNVTLERATISGNTVAAGGSTAYGGGALVHDTGTLTIKNSTISGNSSAVRGGGLVHTDDNSAATLVNVTITGNRSDADNSGGETGGGIYIEEVDPGATNTVTLYNTIVAQNYRGSGTTADDVGAGAGAALSASSAFNLIGTGGAGGLIHGVSGNQVGVDPLLSPLADNGGATQTHALLPGSPALDAGGDSTTSPSVSGLPATDQRGTHRSMDAHDADTADEVDIGAYEAHPTLPDIPDQVTGEDTPLSVAFDFGDTDHTITGITATSGNTALVPNANLSLTGTGSSRTLTITPADGQSGASTITVSVTATLPLLGTSETRSDTFVLTVNAVADPPSVTAATTAEDTQSSSGLVVSPNPSDGAEVTHFQIAGIAGGTLYQNDGTTVISDGSYITAAEGAAGLKFTPADDLNTPAGDTFGFTVRAALDSSGTGLSTATAASITVTEANDPPIPPDDTLTDVAEGSGARTVAIAALLANDTPGPADESGQTLTLVSVGSAVGGTVSIAGTDVVVDLDPEFSGTASFAYTVEDNGTTAGSSAPQTATATVSFTVTEENDPPVATDDTPADVAEDAGPTAIPFADLLANDSAGPPSESTQALTITAVSGAVGGTAAISGTDVMFTPAADYFGPAGFTYTVEDNGTTAGAADPRQDTGSVSFTITAVADAPAVTAATTAEDTQSAADVVITPNAADGTEVTHFRITAITGGTLYQADGTTIIAGSEYITVAQGGAGLRFTPAPDLNSPAGDSFGLTVQAALDNLGTGLSTATAATVTVTEVNDPPAAAADTLAAVAEDSGVRTIPFAGLLANDAAGPANESAQVLAITAISNPVGGAAAISGTDVMFTLDADFSGTAGFTYTVQNNGTTAGTADPRTATGTVTFAVTPVNDAPVAQDGTLAVQAGKTATGILSATDADGDTLTFSVVDSPTLGTLTLTDPATGAFGYAAGAAGTDSFTFRAGDGTADSNVATVTVTVTAAPPPNRPPAASDDSYSLLQDTALVVPAPGVLANDLDPEHDPMTAVPGTGPAHGRLALNADGSFTYTPDAGFHGSDQFTYTAWATGGASPAATVAITVQAAGDVTPPHWPGGGSLAASAIGPAGLDLSWTAAADDTGVVGYRLYANGEFLALVTGQAYTVAGLTPGRTYTFRLEAGDAAGNWSAGGPAVTVTLPAAAPTDPPAEPPAEPPVEPGCPAGAQCRPVEAGGGAVGQAAVVTGPSARVLLQGTQAPPGFRSLDQVWEFAPAGDADTEPVTVAIPLAPADLPGVADPEKVGLFRLDAGGTLTFAGGRLEGGRLVVQVDSRSRYVLAEVNITFTDLADHWVRADAELMAAKYAVRGLPDGRFDPAAPVTRAQFVAMLVRAMGLSAPPVPIASFADVRPGDWFYGDVSAAVAAGLVQGIGDGTFAPNAPVTREQAAVMVMRALREQGKAGGLTAAGPQAVLAPFADRDAASAWAVADLAAAVEAGILRGGAGGMLAPGAGTTRAEAVAIIARFWRR